ncbi:hypothetical protein D3C72_1199630 [compost metagenome]
MGCHRLKESTVYALQTRKLLNEQHQLLPLGFQVRPEPSHQLLDAISREAECPGCRTVEVPIDDRDRERPEGGRIQFYDRNRFTRLLRRVEIVAATQHQIIDGKCSPLVGSVCRRRWREDVVDDLRDNIVIV